MQAGNTTPDSPPARLRLDHIDGLRAIAALWVVSYHMWVRFLPSLSVRCDLQHAWWLLPLGWCRYGHFAVDIFIVISGFCLALPVANSGGTLRGGTTTFWKKRARRILPTYYAAILVTLPLCWLFIDWSRWFVTLKGVVLHVFLLNDVFNNNEISSVYWSIAVECHIYLLFPILVLLWRKFGVAWSFAFAAGVGATLYAALRGSTYIGATPQYLVLFGMGMLAASISANSTSTKIGRRWSAVAFVFAAGVLILCGSGMVERVQGWLGDWSNLALDTLVGCGAATVIVVAASRPSGTLARVFSIRPLVLVGTFSYSLYLVHAPIHFICMKTIWVLLARYIPGLAAYPLFVAISLPIILAGALAFYLVFEAPFLNPGAAGALEDFARRARSQSPLLGAIDRLVTRPGSGSPPPEQPGFEQAA